MPLVIKSGVHTASYGEFRRCCERPSRLVLRAVPEAVVEAAEEHVKRFLSAAVGRSSAARRSSWARGTSERGEAKREQLAARSDGGEATSCEPGHGALAGPAVTAPASVVDLDRIYQTTLPGWNI